MSATAVREKGQPPLPADVCEPAGVMPGDQIDWRFEAGEIRGRKLKPSRPLVLDIGDVAKGGILPKGMKFNPEDIAAAVREEREEA